MADDSIIDPIVAAIQAGDPARAEGMCRVALSRDPVESNLLLLLGLCLQRQGRNKEAVSPYRRLTELHPDEALHWGNYATALERVGDIEPAAQAAEVAARLMPENPDLLEQLGVLRMQLDRPREAQAALLLASRLSPDSASIHIHAAQACVACRDQRAEELLRSWREWLPLPDDQQLELAGLLIQVSEPWDAMEILEGLAQGKPTDWPTQLLLAKVYERVNRVDDAEAKLHWIAAMTGPSSTTLAIRREIMAQRAQLAMRRRSYGEARHLLEEAGPGDGANDGHYFALARACDRLGDVRATLSALATAHAIQMTDLKASNPELLEPGAPLLPHVNDRVSEDDYRRWPVLRAPDHDQSPVFVVGFPRSGTTLLEQMLDAHPQLQSMDERPFMNILAHQLADIGVEIPAGLDRLDQRDCDELRKGYVLLGCGKVSRRWNERLVDKNPLNMLWLPMIHRLFPRAKFILALRHPCDVIWSCYLQDFRAAPLAAACRSLPNLANAYVAAMRNWLDHVRVFQPDIFVSRYEELVTTPSAQAEKIAAFLQIGSSDAMLQFDARAREKGFIRTPSYTQVVEPINTRGLGHWQRYRESFDKILPVLKPMLDQWGYGTQLTAAAAEA